MMMAAPPSVVENVAADDGLDDAKTQYFFQLPLIKDVHWKCSTWPYDKPSHCRCYPVSIR